MKLLITGGTGTLGMKLVEKYSQHTDFNITFTYYNNETKAAELSQKYGCRAIKINDVENDYDIIINNVGIVNSLVPCEDVEIKNWNETININLTLPFVIIKNSLRHMKKNGWGRIVNISSIYGVVAEEDVTPYTVSKHGLIGLTKSVAKEYAQFGITCNAICPGTIISSLSERLADYYTANIEERKEYFETLNNAVPAKRLVKPEEVVDFVFYITSNEAAYINGATLMIDGGYTA